MHYIVLDFEWNQPLSEKEMLMEPFPFDSEIIEIGAIKLDESFQTVDEFKTFIRPQFYPHLSNAVVQLTKIRPQELPGEDALEVIAIGKRLGGDAVQQHVVQQHGDIVRAPGAKRAVVPTPVDEGVKRLGK